MPHRLARLAWLGAGVALTSVPWYAYQAWRRANPLPSRVHDGDLPVVVAEDDGATLLPKLFAAKQPVIIKGLSSSVSHLEPERLRARYGSDVVTAFAASNPDRVFYPGERELSMTIADLLDKVFVEAPGEMRYHGRLRDRVLADYTPPNVAGYEFERSATALWVSQRDHLTTLHLDYWHGLLFQVVGEKQVTLFPPQEVARLHLQVHPLAENKPNTPLVPYNDFHRASPDLFPLLRDTTRYEHRLRPGETLYVPPYWWHQVISMEPCISFATRYNSRLLEKVHPVVVPSLHILTTAAFRNAWTGLQRALATRRRDTAT